jgi:outer membrane protein assembly factor BamB
MVPASPGPGGKLCVAALTALAAALACAGGARADRHALHKAWTVQTRGSIAARPVERKGVVFAGSWDGREYAITAKSGRVRWKRMLGVTRSERCSNYQSAGVTSSPVFSSGLAYLGGGDSNFYALDAASGGVRWRVPTGDNSPSAGHYNWSSPSLFGGHAFVGVSSLCDQPLVQGQLLRIDTASHAIDGVWNVVPDGRVGGTIWTRPVVESGANRVFVTTGNGDDAYAESIVALDATSLAPLDSWKLADAERVLDSDWGTSPTLFADASGRGLVAAANKNGVLYAWQRDRLAAGPVWRRRIAVGGPCPNCGAGTVSTGAFDGSRLFWAGGGTKLRGTTYRGSVRAIDPASGRLLWSRGVHGAVLGGLVQARGMLFVPAQSAFYVLRARDGKILHENDYAGDSLWATPLVDRKRVVVGTLNGKLFGYRLPR